jgi:hypothetical protein
MPESFALYDRSTSELPEIKTFPPPTLCGGWYCNVGRKHGVIRQLCSFKLQLNFPYSGNATVSKKKSIQIISYVKYMCRDYWKKKFTTFRFKVMLRYVTWEAVCHCTILSVSHRIFYLLTYDFSRWRLNQYIRRPVSFTERSVLWGNTHADFDTAINVFCISFATELADALITSAKQQSLTSACRMGYATSSEVLVTCHIAPLSHGRYVAVLQLSSNSPLSHTQPLKPSSHSLQLPTKV